MRLENPSRIRHMSARIVVWIHLVGHSNAVTESHLNEVNTVTVTMLEIDSAIVDRL